MGTSGWSSRSLSSSCSSPSDTVLEPLQYLLGLLSGSLVGLLLGLVGGGGSILAVPLMVYLVGVSSPHVAIGTSALAVAANAAIGRSEENTSELQSLMRISYDGFCLK